MIFIQTNFKLMVTWHTLRVADKPGVHLESENDWILFNYLAFDEANGILDDTRRNDPKPKSINNWGNPKLSEYLRKAIKQI